MNLPRRQEADLIGIRSVIVISAFVFAALMTAFPGTVAGGMEPVERIVAVVGNEPILASELALQMQLLAINQGIRPESPEEVEELRLQVLEQMISEQLLLIEAKKDTAIRVSSAEVERALNDRVTSIASQYPTEDQFLEALAREGMNYRAFKRRLWPEVENQIYKQRLISSKLARISISKQEVYDFYEDFKDSIPEQPETVRLAHILIQFQPSKMTVDSIRQLAESVRKNAVAGADFITLAMTHSSGPAALNGGDLGYISLDDVMPEFGRAAFNLNKGDISGVVKTPSGLHIIKCEDREGDMGRFRQILFSLAPGPADTAQTFSLVDSLVAEIENGADFRELAKTFSADDESRKQGGELGWFPVEGLPPIFAEALDSLNEPGDIFGPVKSEFGLHILKLLDHREGHRLTIDEDFDKFKEMARQNKTGEYVDKWISEIRDKTFVEIRSLTPE